VKKTAITTPFRLFEFPFISFGLRNAAQTFQRFMDEILREFDFCFTYSDDTLVYSRSPEQHERHFQTLFRQLQAYGVVLIPANVSFESQKLHFWGSRLQTG